MERGDKGGSMRTVVGITAVLVAVGAAWMPAAHVHAQCGIPVITDGSWTTGDGCTGGYVNEQVYDCDGTAPCSPGESCQCHADTTYIAGTDPPCKDASHCGAGDTCNGQYDAARCGGSCGSGIEVCNGIDDDSDGIVDEGCAPVPADRSQDMRLDVRVGSGALVLSSRTDVRYQGSSVPIVLSRSYTSKDGWPLGDHRVLGRGWFTTFDERLFASDALSAPVHYDDHTYVHRTASGRGRVFSDPNKDGIWTTTDGSLDALTWNGFRWELADPDGVTTEFDATGRITSRKDTRGQGWTVSYDGNGNLAAVTANAPLDQQIRFNWSCAATGCTRYQLDTVKDVGGTVLATFTHAHAGLFLLEVSSAMSDEEYAYSEHAYASGSDSGNIVLPYLTTILRDGDAAMSVTYDDSQTSIGTGSVSTIQASDGSYAFRYAGDSRNACPYASRSTLIVDRSTSITGGGSCVDDASGDQFCQSLVPSGEVGVCDAGTCRQAACQSYLLDSNNEPSATRIDTIAGNYTGGGVADMVWNAAGAEYPAEVAYETDRNGRVTTYAYDSRGRRVAECVSDNDTSVTTTPSSCPSSGVYTSWSYSASWPTSPADTKSRGRLSSGFLDTTVYTWNGSHHELDTVADTGQSRDLSDTVFAETRTSSYGYDSYGRVNSVTGPAGQSTTYDYYGTGQGANSGLLKHSVAHDGSYAVTATYSSYTPAGFPQSVARPWGDTEAYSYDFGGMRLLSRTAGGLGTTFSYYPSGRLEEDPGALGAPEGVHLRHPRSALSARHARLGGRDERRPRGVQLR